MAVPLVAKEPPAKVQLGQMNYGKRRQVIAWLFIAPLLILNVLVILGPSIGGVFISFTEWSGLGPAKFVGIDNYLRMIKDPLYLGALGNNLKWTLIFLTVPIIMGLTGATLLAPLKRGQMLFRTGFFIPYMFSSVVNVELWRNILHPQLGIGPVLAQYGIPFLKNVSFLGDTRIVLYSIAFVDNWHWWGFLVVVYLAAMQAIDPNLIEVARLEGANRWQEFRHVVLPGIRSTLVFTLLMTIIWSFLSFDYVWQFAHGGPANASQMLATVLYSQAFERFDVGYAASIGVSMSMICSAVILGFVILRRRGWEI